jgi:hypothetical protein
MIRIRSTLWATAVALLLCVSVARGQTPCVGDCNGNMMVTINELILGVNIALGNQPLSACEAFDCQNNGTVPINCLILAVNNAANNCMPVPTRTPTPTGGTATPTSTPMGQVTVRTFQIAPGTLLAPPETTGTGIFTSALGNSNAAQMVSAGPLVLQLGAQGANGIAPLALGEDVIIEGLVVDNSRLCLKFFAADSVGEIDCDGGTAYDILATRPSLAPGVDFEIQTGLGSAAGAGNGELILMGQFQLVPANDSTPCAQVTYTNPVQDFGLTTTNGISEVDDTVLSLTIPGQPFNCAQFGTAGSGGRLVMPAPANQAPVGDVANAFRFSEN